MSSFTVKTFWILFTPNLLSTFRKDAMKRGVTKTEHFMKIILINIVYSNVIKPYEVACRKSVILHHRIWKYSGDKFQNSVTSEQQVCLFLPVKPCWWSLYSGEKVIYRITTITAMERGTRKTIIVCMCYMQFLLPPTVRTDYIKLNWLKVWQ